MKESFCITSCCLLSIQDFPGVLLNFLDLSLAPSNLKLSFNFFNPLTLRVLSVVIQWANGAQCNRLLGHWDSPHVFYSSPMNGKIRGLKILLDAQAPVNITEVVFISDSSALHDLIFLPFSTIVATNDWVALCHFETCVPLTLMLVVSSLAYTKWCKNPEKWLKPCQMGTHLRELNQGYLMNTNIAGFRWFSKIFESLPHYLKG